MGSFVPFGGFFPTPSDYRPPVTAGRQSFTRCNACNEKYEQELGATLREGSSVPSDDHHSAALPSWLQRSDSDLSRGDVVAQVCNSFSSIMVPPFPLSYTCGCAHRKLYDGPNTSSGIWDSYCIMYDFFYFTHPIFDLPLLRHRD